MSEIRKTEGFEPGILPVLEILSSADWIIQA